MKKKVLSIVFIAAIAVAGAWNFVQDKSEVILPDIALANVEALAQSEGNSHYCLILCSPWVLTYCVLETSTSYVYCMDKYPN